MAAERVRALAGRYRVFAPDTRIAEDEFYDGMLRSRICVSPFGYGEICWRDFEAVCCGCLLIKAGHVAHQDGSRSLHPRRNLRAVRWDYSDLEEKCAFFLDNDRERRTIAENAAQALTDSLRPDWFLARIDKMLSAVATPLVCDSGSQTVRGPSAGALSSSVLE